MRPRRTLTILGPTVALCAMVSGLVCGCLPWSVDVPSAAAFVGRSLAEGYGIALTTQGRTELSLLPLPRIGFSKVRLTAGEPDGPVLAEGGSLTVQLSLASMLLGRAEVVSLSLDGAHVTLPASDDDTRWNGPLARMSRALSGDGASHPRRITLSHATVTGRDPRDGRSETATDVDLALSWPLWSDSAAIAGGLTWNGAAARFTLTSLRPDDLLAGRETPFGATLTWPAGSLTAEGTGSLVAGLTLAGQGSFKTRSLPETLGWIGGDIGLSPLIEAFSIDGRFEASREGLRLPVMRVGAGGTVLEGAGSIEMSGRRASIRATLDARDLNLAPVLAGLLRITGLDGEEAWSRRSLALGPLTGGDLDLRLSGASARIGPVVAEDLASSVIVRADGIDVTLGRASLRGGTLKGRIALSTVSASASEETEVKAQGAFDGLDLGSLLVDLGESGWMLGASQGGVSIEGRGRDAATLVRTLSGRVSLAVDGGAIAGLDLADVIHRGGAVAQGALARRNGRTAFERAGLTLAFSDGIGEIEDGGLTARTLSARLRGRISLPERSFLARAALMPRKGPTEKGAPEKGTTEAASLAVPTSFEIAGPWDAVVVRAGSRNDSADPAEIRMPVPSAIVPGLPTQVRAFAP